MNGCKVFDGLVPLSTHAERPNAVLFFARRSKKNDACLHDEVRMESKNTLVIDPQPG